MSLLNRILLLSTTFFVFEHAYSQCNNCTNTYTSNSAIVATADNQTICITGGSFFTVISNYKNVTVKICAPNVQLTNVQLGATALSNTIESFGDNTNINSLVTEADTFSFIAHNTGASLTSATINGMSRFRTTAGATLTITPNLNPGKKIFIIAEDNSTVNTAAITSNQGGIITVGKSAKLNTTGTVILQNDGFILNNGAITTTGDFTVQNGGNAITNFCGESTITISGKLIINSGILYNAGIVKAATIVVNANAGPVYPNEGSQIIATSSLETTNTINFIRGDSIKAGECALFKVAAFGSWNAPLSNSSQVKYCGPTATSAQLGQALADCNCLSEPKLCVPLCTAPTAVTITAPVNNVCAGGSTILTANATGLKAGDTYTYSWYKTSVLAANLVVTNTNVTTLTVSTSGTYFVVVANTIKPADCSTQNTAGFVFTVNPIPPQPSITAGGPLTFCNGGSVSLTAATAGFTGGTYTWSDGSTANPLVVSASGTYTVTYKSADNCTAPVSASTTVTVNPIPPQPTVAAGGPLTFCNGGSVSLTAATAGFTGGTYTWSDGSTANPLVVSASGTFTVTYKSASNCTAPVSASTTVVVNPIPPQPTVAAGGPLTFCNGSSVSLTAATAGFTGGTYTWSNGSTSNPLVVTTGGTYTVTYKSASNCTAPVSASTTVTVNPIPPKPTVAASGPLTFCNGGSVSLTAATAGFTGGTYTWSNGSTTNPLVVTTGGTYTVTYKSADNCTAPVSASTTVVVNPIPPQPTVAAGGPLTFCNGGSVSLTAATAGFTGGTYTWSNGSTSNPLVVTTSGTYTVTYKSANNCTAPVSASTTVVVNPIPPKPTVAAGGPLTFCNGGSVSLTAATAGFTGGTYTWSNGSTSNPLVVTTGGTYTVTYKSADNCTAPVSASTTVVVNPIPPQPTVAAGGPLTFCNGGSVSLTAATAGFTGGTYTWSNGSTSNPLVVTTSGTFTVTYKSANNCTAPVSASVTVLVNPIPPQPTVAAGGPLTFCDGGSVSLTASTAGFTGGTYTWSNGSTSNPLVVTTSGTYTVTYKSADNCTAPVSASTRVLVNPIPPKPVITAGGPLTFCDGGSVSLTAASAGFTGGTYTWSNGSTSNPLVVTTSGTYTVTYKSADNCTAPISASVTVLVNPIPPQPTVVASGPLTFCNGGSVSLTASTAGFTGGTYTWSNGSTSNPLVVTTSGTFTVTYKSADNCTAPVSASTTVLVNPIPPKPVITAGGPLTFCDGGSISLTAATAGFTGGTYTWSNGSTSNPLVVTTSGTFTVTYKSADNCTAPVSASTTVIVNPIPPQPTITAGGPLTFCNGGSVSLTAATAGFTGGTYTWSNGSTSNPLVVTTSGTFTVTYKSASNCTAPVSESVAVLVNPIPPKPVITAGGPLTFCDGGSVSLAATTAGFTGGTYTWSNGSTSNPLVVTTSGTFTVTYKSADNCTAPVSASKTVIVNPIPPQPVITAGGPLTFCNGGSVSLTAATAGFTGGTYTWSNGSTSNPLVVTTSGTFTVTYKSASNCTAPVSESVAVLVNPIPPKPVVTAGGPLTFCDGGSVSLTAATAGFTGGTYTWSNGSTSNPLVVTTSGNYTVTYKSADNCTAPVSASTTVIVNPIPPQPSITAGGPLTFCDGGSVSLTAATAGFTGGTYTWSNGSTSNPLVVTASGTFTVTYTSASSCTAPVSVATTVLVNPIPPQPVVTAAGPLTFCDGGSVSLAAESTGFTGGTYTWSNGSTSNPLVVTTSGTFTVTYKSADNCTAPVSAATTVLVNPIPPQPVVTAGGPLTFCDGGSVSLTAATVGFTGGSYTWSNSSTDNPLVVSTSGTFTVTFTSADNCTAPVSASTTVIVNPIPPQPTIEANGPLTFCDGGSVSLTAATAGFTGGTYTWSNGSSTNPLVVTASGTFSVTYKSASNCTAPVSESVDVLVNPIPQNPALLASGPLSFCPGDFVTLRAESAGFTGALEWFKGNNSLSSLASIDVYDAGDYSVKFTSEAGCTSNQVAQFSIDVLPLNSPVSLGIDIITCNTYIDLSAAASSYGNGVWSIYNNSTLAFLSKADSIKVRAEGLLPGNTYSFIYTVSGACGPAQRDTISIIAGLPDFDIASVETPHDTLCVGVSRRVEVHATGGTGNFKYNWIQASSHDTTRTSGNYLDIVPTNVETTYYVYVEDLSKLGCKTFQDTLTISAVGKQVLMIPNLITPNEDGKNDEFRIVEKDNFNKKMFPAQSYLEVYNRWGTRVFEANNYEGNWKADDTSDGMYYYYLKTGCGNEEYKGWVQILANRN
ncbi:gliding motility-associated C-terminal domain-containing protein [Cytophaga aurantiaca]|uniref:gliding motility-associated C-terminal domain-containing protein n=1 Tax=Cytophaga aurantiaca TaxID=29530 RepID=UPI0003697EB0|nr:gliding motility-associated C-terminal domain-containing protein [Cytophaga aurantiaca]